LILGEDRWALMLGGMSGEGCEGTTWKQERNIFNLEYFSTWKKNLGVKKIRKKNLEKAGSIRGGGQPKL